MTAAAIAPKPIVVLIDLSSIYHPAWRYAENQPQSMAIAATLDMVNRCAKKDPTALVAICVDSRKSWRKELVPTYKAQREKLPNDFYGTLDRVKERLVADGYLLWEADGFEADDVIATATEAAVSNGHEVMICSSDHDMFQLLRPGVRQFRMHDNSIWDQTKAEGEYSVNCAQLGDLFALAGEAGDGVPGAPGVGLVNAAKALGQWGNLTALGAALESDIGACGRNQPKKKAEIGEPRAWAKSINDNFTQVMTARKLVDLRKDVPIKFDEIYRRRDLKPLTTFKDDQMTRDFEPASDGISPGSAIRAARVPSMPTGETGEVGSVEGAAGETGASRTTLGEPAKTAAPGELPPDIKIGELVPFGAPKEKRPAVVVSAQFERQLEPCDLKEAFWLAQGLFESRVYGQKWGTPHAIWLAIIRGREMGFPAAVSLDLFHPMDSGLALKSNTIHGLAEKLPECEYIDFIESTERSATWVTKRKGRPERQYTYTREMAVQAGLCGPDPLPPPPKGQRDARGNWDKRSQNMCLKTARDNLIRAVYPSAGAMYTVTELGGDDGEN